MTVLRNKSGRLRDFDRQKVYDAEAEVFDGTLFSEVLGEQGVTDLAATLFADPWWVANVRRTPGLRATRREAHASHARQVEWMISFAVGQERADVLMHEAAHLMCAAWYSLAIEAHGSEFRAAELDLCLLMFGQQATDRLERSFTLSGLDLSPRRNTVASGHERGIYGLWRIGHVTGN